MIYVIITKKYVVFAYRQNDLYNSLINTKILGNLFTVYARVDRGIIAENRGLYFELQSKTTNISTHIFDNTDLKNGMGLLKWGYSMGYP